MKLFKQIEVSNPHDLMKLFTLQTQHSASFFHLMYCVYSWLKKIRFDKLIKRLQCNTHTHAQAYIFH